MDAAIYTLNHDCFCNLNNTQSCQHILIHVNHKPILEDKSKMKGVDELSNCLDFHNIISHYTIIVATKIGYKLYSTISKIPNRKNSKTRSKCNYTKEK